MKTEELAFANRQLAGMLKAGIPLEGALKRLCQDMRRGALRGELELLEGDLAQGVALGEALGRRKLPALYVRMIQAGVKGNDLPGVLLLLADHYHRAHLLGTRLRGLMVYPSIVLLVALGLCTTLAFGLGPFTQLQPLLTDMLGPGVEASRLILPRFEVVYAGLFSPVFLLGFLGIALSLVMGVRSIRNRVMSWIPAFRDAQLARMAGTLGLLTQSGCTFPDALAVVRRVEAGGMLEEDLAHWEKCAAAGQAPFTGYARTHGRVPELFFWLIACEGENLPGGLVQAAEFYYERATSHAEMLLYAALPASILVLGIVVLSQFYWLFRLIFGTLLSTITVTDQLGS